jgi:hypothetical protein
MRPLFHAASLMCLVCLGLVALSGCATNPSVPPGAGRVQLAVRWLAPTGAAAGADSLIDRLTAEAVDASGTATGDTASLHIFPDRTFRGSLVLRAGAGRSVRVRAFARGDEFYRGTSDPFSVRADDSVQVGVTLRPSVALRLSQVVRPVVFGDSVDLALRCTATAALRGVQVDVRFDPALLTFARPLSHPAALGGFDWAAAGPGRLRVVLYGASAGERVAPGDGQELWVLRFASCQLGVCNYTHTSPIALDSLNAVAVGVHGLSQPLTVAADSLEFQP